MINPMDKKTETAKGTINPHLRIEERSNLLAVITAISFLVELLSIIEELVTDRSDDNDK